MSIRVESEDGGLHVLTRITYDAYGSPYRKPLYGVSWRCDRSGGYYSREFRERESPAGDYLNAIDVDCEGCDAVISVDVSLKGSVELDDIVTVTGRLRM